MSECKHDDVRIEDVEIPDDTYLKVKVRCDRCGLIGFTEVLSTQIEHADNIEWEKPPCFPMPESCEGCHCKGDMEFDAEEGAWVCNACGNDHYPPQNYEETHSYLRNAGTCVGGESE